MTMIGKLAAATIIALAGAFGLPAPIGYRKRHGWTVAHGKRMAKKRCHLQRNKLSAKGK